MDLNGFVQVSNYKYTVHCVQYTPTNTHFSYTFIYEHTDKSFTYSQQQIQKKQ